MELAERKPMQPSVQHSYKHFPKPPKNGHFTNLSYSGSEALAGSESSYTSNDTHNYGSNKNNHMSIGQNRPNSQVYIHPETHGPFMGQIPGYDRRSRYFRSTSSSADSLAFANMSPPFIPQEYQGCMKDEIRKEISLSNRDYNENVSVSASSDNMSNAFSSYSSNYNPQYQAHYHQGQYTQYMPPSGYANVNSYLHPANELTLQQKTAYVYPQNGPPVMQASNMVSDSALNGENIEPKEEDSDEGDSTESFLTTYYARNDTQEPATTNELLSKSRHNTIKSNRYSSLPLSVILKESNPVQKRVSSVAIDFKPKESHLYNLDSANDSQEDTVGEINNLTQKVRNISIKGPSRQISDYNKFLFEDSDDENEGNDNQTQSKQKEENKKVIDLNLNRSSSSVNSYNSIGTEKNFTVRSETSFTKQDMKQSPMEQNSVNSSINGTEVKTHRKCSSEILPGAYAQVPSYLSDPMQQLSQSIPMMPLPQQMPQMPVYNNLPPQGMYQQFMYPNMNMNYPPGMMMPYGSQYIDPNMHNPSPFENQRMPMMPGQNVPMYNKRHSLGAIPAQRPERNLDRETNKKIEKFVNLRQVIAGGNKSKEFRLKWTKMLIYATKHQLYMYINIKGSYIEKSQVGSSHSQFVKSSITHLMKLIKECKTSNVSDEIKVETFYLYGCIMKQDYLQFGQDFNIEKNLDIALEYFDKCLEIREEFYKARYKLGEIYEEVGDYENALNLYKGAAKYGYNRAIYKVAHVYQNSPAHQSLKFLKYYLNLSNIDLELVTLVEEDREELDDIVGMAAYELGKIYEGIYPSHLLPEDEFLKEILELVPVNYSKSLSYYNKAAKLGNLLAQVKLGLVYENGDLNREVKPGKSIQWFIKAATSKVCYKRHPEAMLGLSRWYLNIEPGMSTHIRYPDHNKSMMWCDRAIKEFNSAEAYYFMGILAEMGINPSNPEDWFAQAASLGYIAPNEDSFKTDEVYVSNEVTVGDVHQTDQTDQAVPPDGELNEEQRQ